MLAHAIQLVQALTDLPLSIDSSIVEALEAGLAVPGARPSSTRSRARPPGRGAAVVAISNDETGISEDPDVRYAVAKRIVERALDHGIPREDVVVDPLLMPIEHSDRGATSCRNILGRLRDELDRQHCGASNVSFGLPFREGRRPAPTWPWPSPAASPAPVRQHAAGGDRHRRPDGQRPRVQHRVPPLPRGAGRGRGRRINRRRAAAVS